MAPHSNSKPRFLQLFLSLPLIVVLASTGTIQDVEHVVLFMQENRAFDHYFGSMAGVRGFADPNIHIAQDGLPIWFQPVNPSITNATTHLLPFYVNGAGGNLSQATQCMKAGSNAFKPNHAAFAQGDNNRWPVANTPFSWGHYKRQDLPTQFALADAWTVGDMYTEGVMASTNPNRAFWASGSVNVPGGPQNLDQGGVITDNSETVGCEAPNLNCFPFKWKTFAEFLEAANVTWQVYQEVDNGDNDPFAWFNQFQTAPVNSSLAQRGLAFIGLQPFFDAAAAGTLPAVSYVVGQDKLSEHPPFLPSDGAWLQQQIVNAVINSPKYSSTVLFISFDETGGFGDHVIPITAPKGTPGEWMTNPFNTSETVFAGPGFRVPFLAVSPWTRGGNVFTAHSDHSSQIMFMEKWLTAKGISNVVTDQLNSWRRDHMSDLTQMFDFAHPDLTIPDLPVPTPPLKDSQGNFIGSDLCLVNFPNHQPPIPFGQQTRENSLDIETGFKESSSLYGYNLYANHSVRGALTEGRFLVFESGGQALAFDNEKQNLSINPAVPTHDVSEQRFVLHATAPPPATTFNLQFAGSPSVGFVDHNLQLTPSFADAGVFNITDLGSGLGYTIQKVSEGHLAFSNDMANLVIGAKAETFQIFSVTKSTDSGTGFLPVPHEN